VETICDPTLGLSYIFLGSTFAETNQRTCFKVHVTPTIVVAYCDESYRFHFCCRQSRSWIGPASALANQQDYTFVVANHRDYTFAVTNHNAGGQPHPLTTSQPDHIYIPTCAFSDLSSCTLFILISNSSSHCVNLPTSSPRDLYWYSR
jgi:hypothetical protein